MSDAPEAWRIEEVGGTAADLHGRDPSGGREVWVQRPARPALVLGSTQRDDVVDHDAAARAGVDVVRRRSGGGAVLVEPGGVVWVDVVIPPGDPLWDDDVARAAHWVGETWAAALAATGVPGVEVHRGPMVTNRWSPLVCFAGIAAGEVSIGGAKAVGVSQRRTRAGARFQTAALLRWEPDRLLDLLVLSPGERERARADVAPRAAALPTRGGDLVAAFVAALPAA